MKKNAPCVEEKKARIEGDPLSNINSALLALDSALDRLSGLHDLMVNEGSCYKEEETPPPFNSVRSLMVGGSKEIMDRVDRLDRLTELVRSTLYEY